MKKIISLFLVGAMLGTAPGALASQSPSLWAKAAVEDMEKYLPEQLKTDYQEQITRLEVCQFIYHVVKSMGITIPQPKNIPFQDCSDATVSALSAAGIVQGKSETSFAPDEALTREEFAVISDRMISYLEEVGITLNYSEALSVTFRDENDISDWAKDAVHKMQQKKIIQGTELGEFLPKENLTREQAIVILARIRVGVNVGQTGATARPEQTPSVTPPTMLPSASTSAPEIQAVSFADRFNEQISDTQNYMFSPLSIKMALAMAANGSEKETRTEILKGLQIEDLEKYNQQADQLIQKYSGDIIQLNIANSAWINQDLTKASFQPDFLKVITEQYHGTADVIHNADGAKKINDWISSNTNQRIQNMVEDESVKDWLATLVNAVYFKANWRDSFNEDMTKKEIFTGRDGKKTEIDFMHKTSDMNYGTYGDIQILELPYATVRYTEEKIEQLEDTNISMYLFLGNDRIVSPEAVLGKVDMKNERVILSMPKFKTEFEISCKEILQNMGMERCFTDDAQLNKMIEGEALKIDAVLHKTFIDVDENGTEAAAVTVVANTGTGMMVDPPEPITFCADKPFTYVIRDNISGEILFMGEYAYAKIN